MNGIEIYQKLAQPPREALREIKAGRLSGKTDINPQWRYKAMTETFGLCGDGWTYKIKRMWTEPGPNEQVFAFAEVDLFTKIQADEPYWSEPIPGIGGHMLIPRESKGLYANDEAFKMAVTDALSVAMKMLGMAADVYAGMWDGSKYKNGSNGHTEPPPKQAPKPTEVSKPQKEILRGLMKKAELTDEEQKQFYGWVSPKTANDAKLFIESFDKQLAEWRNEQEAA